MPPEVWIDTDVALGASRGDVDDGFAIAALLAAARTGRVRLAGISTVFGNTTAASAEVCAGALLDAASVNLPVDRGAEWPGQASSAAERIARLPPDTDIVALGPLTNVAAALRGDPSLPGRVSLRIVGGNLSSRGFLAPLWPFEFNLSRDVESTRRVLAAPWRSLVLYPLDVVSVLRVDEARLRRLEARSGLGALLARGSQRWLRRARWRHLGRGFPVWDLPAALEAAGLLTTPKKTGFLRLKIRPFSGNITALQWVTGVVPNKAWVSFESLLLESPSPDL